MIEKIKKRMIKINRKHKKQIAKPFFNVEIKMLSTHSLKLIKSKRAIISDSPLYLLTH